jgi:hypothetical protein
LIQNAGWFNGNFVSYHSFDIEPGTGRTAGVSEGLALSGALIAMETLASAQGAGVPRQKLEFRCDYRSRRVWKKVSSGWNGSAFSSAVEKRFVYDEGWNLLAEVNAAGGADGSVTYLNSYGRGTIAWPGEGPSNDQEL